MEFAVTTSLAPWGARLGFCSWSVRPGSVIELIDTAKQLELTRLQLALDPLLGPGENWKEAVAQLHAAGIATPSGMVGCVGEDYTTIQSIHETGGVVPDATWPASYANMRVLAPIAAAGGIKLITLHAGFIPEDAGDPVYAKVLERMRQVADLFKTHGLGISLETGQEAAATLLRFFNDLQRQNVGINFDPANMLLYGSGDPIAALRLLGPHVRSCHIKDAVRSPAPGVWGSEVPVGTGQVDWREFFGLLDELKFNGDLMIEREAGEQRVTDIRAARDYLGQLLGN